MKRIRYNTMNSWNKSTAPAYNLKVYQVIPRELREKVYELMECEGFYDSINELIAEFNVENHWEWQAGFNGRSGGYLVLYRGGRKESEYKSYCRECGQRNFKSVEESGTTCGKCGEPGRVNNVFYDVFTMPGESINEKDVPGPVLRAFSNLARRIVADTIYKAKNCAVVSETYTAEKTRKVIA